MTEKDGFPFSWERHKKKTGSMNQTSTSPSPRPLPSRAKDKLYVQDMNLNKLYYKKMGNVKYNSL